MTEVEEALPAAQEGTPREPSSVVPDASLPAAPELTRDGRERPRFLLRFPNDPELQRLVHAFEAGDYGAVRRDAPRLAEHTGDPIVRAAARELRRRIDPDPLMKYLLWVAIALFVFVVWHTYQRQP